MHCSAPLCMVRIYEQRHPDITPSAHGAFCLLAGAILLGTLGTLGVLVSRLAFWVAFSALYTLLILNLSFRIYYMNSSSLLRVSLRRPTTLLALARAALAHARCLFHVCHWHSDPSLRFWQRFHLCVLYPLRFIILLIGNAFNWTMCAH